MATVTFKQFLKGHSKIRAKYNSMTPDQQAEYKAAWQEGGSKTARPILDKYAGEGSGNTNTDTRSFSEWLDDHPWIKNNYNEMNATDRKTYEEIWNKDGKDQAKKFLENSLNITSVENATEEAAPGVHVPTFSKYPTPSLLFTDEEGNFEGAPQIDQPTYTKQEGITTQRAMYERGIDVPTYDAEGAITGGQLNRVDAVNQPGYEKTAGINNYTADSSAYNMVDPMAFARTYGEFYRGEALKNLSVADQMALAQLDTELGGLIDYAQGAAALKRQETSIDNLFNQDQRIQQVNQAVPGVVEDLEGQRARALAYAEGRLPDEMEDRMMELNTRSRAADTSTAAGFGAESAASQKASTLMSAEQRIGLSQYGDQLLSQNVQAREDLLLAPTEYISAGQQISVMPSQSASVLSASALGQLNEQANVSATTAMGTQVNQEQFSANLANDISQFNAALQQDTEKFNANLETQQNQFQANMQAQIDEFNAQMEQAENLSEAEIQQRTQEFNANLATQQKQFQANMQQSIQSFNAQLAVNQRQFNATIAQRTNEFNANLAAQENQFEASLNQRVAEFNTTMEYNTEVANVGIDNAFALGRFDYNVTYKGMVAGALNQAENTRLQMQLAYAELGYYEEALKLQLDFEREKLEKIKEEMEREEDEGDEGGGDEGDEGEE